MVTTVITVLKTLPCRVCTLKFILVPCETVASIATLETLEDGTALFNVDLLTVTAGDLKQQHFVTSDMTAFGTHFAQIAAAHQHATRAAPVPTQLTSLAGNLHALRSCAGSAQLRHRGMVAVTATVATERPTGMQRPDASGRFGKYGGKYVPETLITALAELEAAYAEIKNDPKFQVNRKCSRHHMQVEAFRTRA